MANATIYTTDYNLQVQYIVFLCVIQRLQQEIDENPDSLPFPEVKLRLCKS